MGPADASTPRGPGPAPYPSLPQLQASASCLLDESPARLYPGTRRAAPLGPPYDHEPEAERHERSEEHTSELQSPCNLVCRLLLEKKTEGKVPGETRLGRLSLSPRTRGVPGSRHLLPVRPWVSRSLCRALGQAAHVGVGFCVEAH